MMQKQKQNQMELATVGEQSLDNHGDHGHLKAINVRVGRHVDYIEFVFQYGYTVSYGNNQGGEPCEPFEIDMKRREYVVRIQGRQNKHLDAVQFVTNLGRVSRWYGGAGGEPFQTRAEAGMMIVGLVVGKGEFCPPIKGLKVQNAPSVPPRIGILRLMLQRNVRNLVFKGKPSLFRISRQGSPSVLRLLLKNRMIMTRVMFRNNPCFIRLLLDGEQLPEPTSLFRELCTAKGEDGLSPMQMLNIRNKYDKKSKSLAQLLLTGNPSVGRQFFGKSTSKLTPLVQMLFARDEVNGFPSLTMLLTKRDMVDGIEHPSVFEAILEGEQNILEEEEAFKMNRSKTPPPQTMLKVENGEEANEEGEEEEDDSMVQKMSLMRLMLLDIDGPSIFSLMMEGEREGKESIVRRMVTDKNNDGLSMARMVLSSFENQKGHRPALSTYIFGGENVGRSSILRLLLAGEARPHQYSLLRLLFYRYKQTRPGLFRSASSFRKRAARGNGPKERRSLADLLTAGSPSISDLFFEGELKGEDSLARLMFGTSVQFKDGVLRLGGALSQASESSVSLMQIMLVGEEDGGPGFSFLRLFLVGEKDNGVSLLRLMLMNENEDTNEPSMLRILLTTLKTALIAAKTRPSQFRNGEWKKQVEKISQVVLSSQKQGGSTKNQLERILQSFSSSGETITAILAVLRTIPKRGNEFQRLWKNQWLVIAREIELVGQRAKKNSVWHRNAPAWKSIAEHMAHQRWTQLATEMATFAGSMNGVTKWVQRTQKVTSAISFFRKNKSDKKMIKKPAEPMEESDDDDDDDQVEQ